MSWQLRLVDYKGQDDLKVGDCFYYDPPEGYDWDNDPHDWTWPQLHVDPPEQRLSSAYLSNPSRPPLIVVMPSNLMFCVDSTCSLRMPDGSTRYAGGWQVSGDIKDLTVHPSVNMVGIYHGWIRDGEITDDCEGRTFDEFGRSIRKP